MTDNTAPVKADQYTVLARKYRPDAFAGLIGQQAMVRTLTNAIECGRLAHAYILTGVRGTGKTTTARIIARVLNCVGEDGDGGLGAVPCGVCQHCLAIAEDRHVDVLEMDAASRTGVDDIRELIEGVRYRPTSARYKIYIIDEVHMLSKNAFNALLKTLEEPPEHVKFIFATTEIRKIPVTVLSRCQRFDLRRVDAKTLAGHFAMVAEKEGAEISGPALDLIARAADGSVRDGLSLLDQAISYGSGAIDDGQIREMLGLADRGLVFDLLELLLKGEIGPALELFDRLYHEGADPAAVIVDLLEITHWLTRIKIAPSAADGPGVAEIERVGGRDMAAGLPMAAIARAWQMLLKGLGEVRNAPSPVQAAEMVLVRLAYVSDLPTPSEALRAMADGEGKSPAPAPAMKAVARVEPGPDTVPEPRNLADVAALADKTGQSILHANIINNVHLVNFEPGLIEVRLGQYGLPELPYQMARLLSENTSRRWLVSVSGQAGEPTLQQRLDAAAAAGRAAAAEHPLVRSVLETFPGAAIGQVRKAGEH